MRMLRPRFALFLAVLCSACADSSGPDRVATVTVAPAAATLAPGVTLPLTATMLDGSGRVLTGRSVAWSTSDAAVARVDASSGVVTTVAPGTATITATSEGQSGTAVITVRFPVSTVTVQPASARLVVGANQTLTATVKDASGNVLSGRTVVWSTSDSAVARVSASGVVTAVGVGSATISAVSEGQTGSAAITVVPPIATLAVVPANPTVYLGDTVHLSVVARDAGGNVLTGRAVAWSTSNPSIATVDSAGVVTGVALGTATITATVEGKTASTTATVATRPVAGFGMAVYHTSLESASGLAAGDVNGDGRADLVVTSGSVYQFISVLARTAANTSFAETVYGTSGGNPQGPPFPVPVIADLDGNGTQDVAVNFPLSSSGGSGPLWAFYQKLDHTGFDISSYPTTTTTPSDLAVGDLNGDGRLDLATGDVWPFRTFAVGIWYRNAANTGYDGTNIEIQGTTETVTIGDFNGDGRQDLAYPAAASPVGPAVMVLQRNAANTGFDSAVAYPAQVTHDLVAADLNGDGRMDMAGTTDAGVTVLLRKADNSGFDVFTYPLGTTKAHNIAVADLNGDGRLDLAVATWAGNGGVEILYRNAANTGYDAPVLIAVPGTSSTVARYVAAADLNGDGRMDLAVTNFTNDVTVLYRLP